MRGGWGDFFAGVRGAGQLGLLSMVCGSVQEHSSIEARRRSVQRADRQRVGGGGRGVGGGKSGQAE